MDIEKIESILHKFSDDRDWDQFHSPKNLVMALTGEVGELNEIFQWLSEEESLNPSENVKMGAQEEIADVAIYLLRLCMKLDIDLEEAILSKMKKNEIKYPVHLAKGTAEKYTKLQENTSDSK